MLKLLSQHNTAERITDGIAVGAVTSPMWLDSLTRVSEFSALLLPIFGATWLGIQMFHFVFFKKRDDE